MKYFLVLAIIFTPLTSYAAGGWQLYTSANDLEHLPPYTGGKPNKVSNGTRNGKPYIYSYYWTGTTSDIPITDFNSNNIIYNFSYTDEQCQAAYGGSLRSVDVPTGSLLSSNAVVNVGACKLYQTPGVTFCTNNKDENGNDTGTENCSTIWNAESTGETNNPDSDAPTISDSPFQLTSDPASCSSGSYTSGSNTYCYTGQSSDINTIHIDENGEVIDDTNDGSDSGGSDGDGTGGDGASGGSDGGSDTGGGGSGGGGSSGGGSGGGGSSGGDSGDGSGDDGDGLGAVLDAIAGVRNAISSGVTSITDKLGDVQNSVNDGFEGLVDAFSGGEELTDATANNMIAGSGLDAHTDAMDDAEQQYQDQLHELLEGDTLGSGSDSPIAGPIASLIPSLPAPSCSSLTFFPGAVYSFEIPCDRIEVVRSWLEWLIYFWTVIGIINLFFEPQQQKA